MMRRFWFLLLIILALSVGMTSAQDDALQVVEVLPAPGTPNVAGDAVITVIFDRPVVPLGSVAQMQDLPNPLQITPAIDGTGEWLNTAIYTFRPAIAWGGGVTYTVTVPAGLQAADGTTLDSPFSWGFTTTPPSVIEVMPIDEGAEVPLDQRVQMVFNLPVDQASLESAFYLRPASQASGTVAGSFEWNDTGDGFMFTPDALLDLSTTYVTGYPAGQVFDASGTVAVPPLEWRFTTVPTPTIISTQPFDGAVDAQVYGGPVIYFSGPMDPESFEGLVTIEPEPAIDPSLFFQSWDNGLQISIPSLMAATTYTVTLAPGASDPYGNTVDTAFSFSFTTAPRSPALDFRVPGTVGFYNAYAEQTRLFMTHINVSRLDLSLYTVPLDRFAQQSLDQNYYDPTEGFLPEPNTLLRNWTIPSVAPPNATRYEMLNLAGDLELDAAPMTCPGSLPSRVRVGDVAVVVSDPDPVRARSAPQDGEILDLLYRDYALPVTDGPVCIDGLTWFQVRLRNESLAWVAESVEDEYLIGLQAAGQTTPVTIPAEFTDGEALQPGIYYLTARSPETEARDNRPLRHFLVLATANLTVKLSNDQAVIWATDVQTGEPIPDAPITIYGEGYQPIASGTTDADGLLTLDTPRMVDLYEPRMAVLDDGVYFGVGLSSWSQGIAPWRFGVDASYYARQYQLYMYTDRPIYRPDQPVYFRGVLRNKADVTYTQSSFESVPVRIFDDQNEVIYERSVPLTDYGTFSDTFMLADDAPLGFYRIEVELPSEHEWEREGGQVYFNVAEYRLPEFQVEVTPFVDEVVQGDTVRVTVDSTYFFGGKVSEAAVTYNVISNPYNFNYEGPGGRFDFVDYNPDGGPGEIYGSASGVIASGEGATDAEGRFEIEVPADLQDSTQSQNFVVEVTIRDESGQTVAGRANVVVHQGQVYIGARPQQYVSTAGQDTTLEFVAVDWQSRPIIGQDLAVEVVERRWSSVQEEDPSGRTIWSWEVEEIPVDTGQVTTDGAGRATYDFVPPRGGIYKATITTRDEQGNAVRASTTVWVSSSDYVSWRQQNSNRIDLITDANSYDVGDTAEILITSPFQGTTEALITVERGGVLMMDRITMTSNSTVYALPITADYAPNVFVSVLLVKGVDENNPVTAFRMGVIALEVDNAQKAITIDIQPDSDQAGPGDTVTYTVRTTDYNGAPLAAEVGVGLTDLASLSIGEPNSSPILDFFYGIQPLAVRTATALTINTDQITQTILDTIKGGGGGFGDGGIFDIREEFVDTAYWQADLVTDENGEATFSVTLPDNLTTWRLDARAVTSGDDGTMRVGQDTFDLLSTKPLLIRPVTPRFFTVDDAVMLTAVVNNNTDAMQEVEVRIEGTGVSFNGEVSQTVTIDADGRARVTWPVTVEAVDAVDLTFYARTMDDRYTDASKPPLGQGDALILPVYRYEAPEIVGTGGVLREAETRTEAIAIPAEVTDATLTVQAAPSLAGAALQALDVFVAQNFINVEFTISAFLPNIMTARALEQTGYDVSVLRGRLQVEVEIALQQLAAFQKVDGGWGWHVQDNSDPLVTAYALLGLTTAQQNGFTVDPQIIQRAKNYLNGEFRSLTINTPRWQLDRQAFMLYALAYSNSADVSRSVNLFENRERLSIYAKALLARTFALIGDNDDRVNTLLSDLSNDAIVSANGTHWEETERNAFNWNTNTRTTAIVLGTLVQLQPDSELIPQVVRWLMVAREGDTWETTQETAWAVMALSDWMAQSGELNADYDWSAAVNDVTFLEGTASPQTVTDTQVAVLTTDELTPGEQSAVSITRGEGTGNLYYTAYLRNALPVEQIEALNNGIIVQRRYTLLDDPDMESIDTARIGDVVQVRLTIIAPNDLHFVVVEDPIPAGVEPIDPNLVTSQQIGTRPGAESLDPLSSGWGWWWFSNIEFRDEKVVLNATYLPAGTYEYVYTFRPGLEGTYSVIPPVGYETYFPDVYGRGEGSTFTVLPAE